VARFGALQETSPGAYGVEVLVGSTWVQVGAQTTTWASVSGKPTTFPPTLPISGSSISGAVASATSAASATNAANATEATHAAQADGSEYGFTNNVAGTTFYALWVGNDGGFHFGRNTSSIKYKENVRDAALADAVLNAAARGVRPEAHVQVPGAGGRHPCEGPPQRFEGAKDELGLIAEEVDEHLPQIVTRYEGDIDGVRYDLLGVALLPVVQQQADDIAALKQAVRDLGGNI
jgi:hypothetical protein